MGKELKVYYCDFKYVVVDMYIDSEVVYVYFIKYINREYICYVFCYVYYL